MSDDLLDFPIEKDGKVKSRSVAVLIIIFLNFFCIALAYPLSLYEISSIIFTGPALAVLSLILILLAVVMKKYYLLIPSLYSLVFVASVFLFIVLNELGPRKAREPVSMLILYMGLTYLVPFIFVLWKEFRLPR